MTLNNNGAVLAARWQSLFGISEKNLRICISKLINDLMLLFSHAALSEIGL